MLRLDFFLKLVAAAARTGDISSFLSVPHFFALEFKPGPKLIERKPESWVSVLSKMKMQDCRGARGLDPFFTRICGHSPFVLDRTRAHAHASVPVGHSWQDPSFD